MKTRSRKIADFTERARPFLSDELVDDSEGVGKYLKEDRLAVLLPKLRDEFKKLEVFTADEIEKVLRQRAETEGIKAALYIHAVRMLVLGTKVSPGIFEVLELLGKEKTLVRMSDFKKVCGCN